MKERNIKNLNRNLERNNINNQTIYLCKIFEKINIFNSLLSFYNYKERFILYL